MDSRHFDADVVIVGAGPAGAAAAITCATRGMRVILCERRASADERPGETLHPGVESLMAQLGVGHRLNNVVGARHAGIWVDWAGLRRFEPFGEDDSGPWRGFQVRRRDFDRLLVERAREAGAHFMPPSAVTELLVSQGVVHGVATEDRAINARFVIDASGLARWLGRKLRLTAKVFSPPLAVRYGYAEGSCPERDEAPALVGDASGWTWTAKVWPSTYQWTRLSLNGAGRPEKGWLPNEFKALKARGPARGADVTWRLMAETAGPGWFAVGDAAALLDPTSSHGVLRALMSGVMAGHLAAASWSRNAPEEKAAAAYSQWMTRWFTIDAARLSRFYGKLGVAGFGRLAGCDTEVST